MSSSDSLSLEFELAHPPEKGWRALTDPALLAEWLLPLVGFKLQIGTKFRFQTQAFPGWDGTVNCQLVKSEMPRRISYTWCVPGMETVVGFALPPTETGNRLVLVQSGFKPHQKREFGAAGYGWTMMGRKLADRLGRLT